MLLFHSECGRVLFALNNLGGGEGQAILSPPQTPLPHHPVLFFRALKFFSTMVFPNGI